MPADAEIFPRQVMAAKNTTRRKIRGRSTVGNVRLSASRQRNGDTNSGADPGAEACTKCHQERAVAIAAHLPPAPGRSQ